MGRAKGETLRVARRGPGRGMMGFAALYPSYGLRGRPPIHRRMDRAKGETHRFARRGPGRGMMGFAALYPSYGLRGRPPIHRRMGRAKGETHRFARRGPGRGMMGFAALYPSYGLPLGKSQKKAPGRTRGLIHPVVADQSAWTTLVPAIRSWPQRRSLRKISSTSTIWINAPMSGMTPTAWTGR